jgi:exodeoxyribonuclease V alpha subunit
MTAVDPFGAAVHDSSLVVSAEGLLAEFNEAGVLGPLDVLAATTVARLFGETDEHVILAAAMAIRGTRFGHVCVALDSLRESVVVDGQEPEVVEALRWPDPETWQTSVEASDLVGGVGDDKPLVFSDDLLYLERYFRYEEQVGGQILDRCGPDARPIPPAAQQLLDSLLKDAEDAETRQHAAVASALTGSITVIAGGPGTGKTHTIGALLASLAANGADEFPLVALCAPTGKAAARLGEAIRELAADIDDESIQQILNAVDPSTIHRLLGWSWGRSQFAHSARNRLPHDLVIVDEMSMVSLPMAAKLLSAVRDDATVVLVGDSYQLESIEAGTVLADIVGPTTEETVPTVAGATIADHIVVLDRVHRFESDSVIADFAEAIRSGADDSAVDLLAGGDNDLHWVHDRSEPAFAGLWAALVDQRRRMVELAKDSTQSAAALETLSEMAVLCAHRRGPDSVWRWGRDLEAALDDTFTGLRWDGEWYPGRPVMITRNDYNLELYNGDVGITVETNDGMRVMFAGDGDRSFPLTQLGEYTTVHAMTIHKSQGSQFDEVVVVLPGDTSRMLTRELLYTAVTRAKNRVWVVGGEAAVRTAVTRSIQRASGLEARLWR